MPSICVASRNPVKLNAAGVAFKRLFPDRHFRVTGAAVPSGVADQPMTREETLRGATNRAITARDAAPDHDYWIGIEGGVEATAQGMSCFAWVVALDALGRMGRGQTGVFFLPDEVAALLRSGMELGEADDHVFGRANSKQRNGAIGLLSGDLIDREAYYVHALIMALLPFKNPQLSWQSTGGSHAGIIR